MIETLIYILISWLCVYALIARICECVERCKLAEAYGKYISGMSIKGGAGGFLSDVKEVMANYGKRTASRDAKGEESKEV